MTMCEEARGLQERLRETRRALHQIPEAAGELPLTRAFVTGRLDALGIPYTLNRGDSGLMVVIRGGHPGKTIAFRADMDALPVTEENDVPYRSRHPGMMHACGHDAHTAMLLGAAEILIRHREELHGTVKLLFQAAEETLTGSRTMLREQDLSDCRAIFGCHIGLLQPGVFPSGTVICPAGPFMAAMDSFRITVQGVSCHGSTPSMGVDPILIASHIVLALQTIQTRELAAKDAAALTVCSVNAGHTFNIIPGQAVIQGTVRTFDQKVREQVLRRIGEISSATAQAFRGRAVTEILEGVGPVLNDEDMSALVRSCAAQAVGREHVVGQVDSLCMGSEDFSAYLAKIPGAYFFLHSADREKESDFPHHSPRFNIDEDVLWKGTAVFVSLARQLLGQD